MGARRSAKPGLPTLDAVKSDIRQKTFRPVYVLVGEDRYSIEQVVEHIKRGALDQQAVSFNHHVLQGDQVGLARVLQQARSLPMFGGTQLIWVKQGDQLLGDAESQAAFEAYLGDVVKETILIISMEKADKRKRWVKTCAAADALFDFSPPTGENLVRWVMKTARHSDLELDQEQARLLCDLVGNDQLSLKSEFDKLALLAEDRGRPLTTAEIGDLIMDQAALDGYEITAHLEPGRAGDVLRTWFRLAEWGRSPYEIAPLVLARIRRAALLDACRRGGLDDKEIAARTGQNPWSFRYFDPIIRGLGSAGLQRAQRESLACDKGLKSSPQGPALLLEKTLAKVCATGGDPR